MSTRLTLSSMIYPRACLEEAASDYAALCAVEVVGETPERLDVQITLRQDTEDIARTTNEFLNYLLALSLEKHLTNPKN